MTPQSFVDISGVGHSGKSARVDLLREFSGLWVSEYWFESGLLRVPGGLFDLRHALCDDWSRVRSHAAIKAFHGVVEQMAVDPPWWDLPGLLWSTSQRYDRRIGDRFRTLSHQFANSFVVGRYRAEWPYESLRDSDWSRLVRKILARLGFYGRLLREVLLSDGRDFAARASSYMDRLYRRLVGGSVHTALLNNGFEPFGPLVGLDLLAGSKQLVVTRDPRDVYVSGQTIGKAVGGDRQLQAFDNDGINKSFLATDDIKLFVTFYRLYHEKLYQGSDPRILRPGFEQWIHDCEGSLARVATFLGLSSTMHVCPCKYFDPDKSGRNAALWKRYSSPDEIRFIERELKDHLVE